MPRCELPWPGFRVDFCHRHGERARHHAAGMKAGEDFRRRRRREISRRSMHHTKLACCLKRRQAAPQRHYHRRRDGENNSFPHIADGSFFLIFPTPPAPPAREQALFDTAERFAAALCFLFNARRDFTAYFSSVGILLILIPGRSPCRRRCDGRHYHDYLHRHRCRRLFRFDIL